MSNTQFLYVLAPSILVPCIIGIANYKGLKLTYKLITALILIGALTEGLMAMLSMLRINNLFAVHFYALAEVILLSLFYYKAIQHPSIKKTVAVFSVAFTVFAIVYASYGTNIAQFNSIPRAFECIYFSLLSCWLFYEMSDYLRPVAESDYYLNGAIMFYFTSCFVIFTFNKYMTANLSVLWTMVKAHAIVNAFCNLIYGLALWIASKRYYQHS